MSIMVKVNISNWRCINELSLELSRFNILIGANSSGKSSLAYAIYFASRSSREDPKNILAKMFGGNSFDAIVRSEGSKSYYPICIKIDDYEFSVNKELILIDEEKAYVEKPVMPPSSVWRDEFLLPSRRIGYMQVINFIPKSIKRTKKEIEGIIVGPIFIEILSVFYTLIAPPLGIFIDDYLRTVIGYTSSLTGKNKSTGSYLMNLSSLASLIDIYIKDPYLNLKVSLDHAPDGMIDYMIFDSFTQKINKNSLLILEEPEIHKNPLTVMEFTKHIIKRCYEKDITLITTTHSDILLTTLAKMVDEKKLKPEDVKIYYCSRSEEEPWTKVKEIKLYEDGTLENLPDTEELITRLF